MNYFLVRYNLLGLVFSEDDMPSLRQVGFHSTLQAASLSASEQLGGAQPAVFCHFICNENPKVRWLLLNERDVDDLLNELAEAESTEPGAPCEDE